jgi:DNA polymerase III subunit delta
MSDSNVHILYGMDEFAIGTRVESFVTAMGDPTTAGMNTTRLDARTMNDDDLNNAVNAMPFLAPKRLVILNNVSARYNKADQYKKFIEFLNAVPPTATLVLVEPGVLKETHWLLKWAKSAGEKSAVQAFMLPRKREMPAWIIEETKKQGGRIEPNAAARLAEMVGEETRQAAQEITKLLTYVNFAHPIGLEDVEAVSIVTAQADIFGMVDALGAGNGEQAQKLLHRLLEDEDPFSVFGMIVRQFRLLLLTREVMDARGTTQNVIEALGVAPFVAEKLFGQARGFKIESLEAIYRRLLKMDEDVKTGVFQLDTALEMFVVEVAKR